MAVIGIDLGTTYSAAARCVRGIPEIISLEGKATLPSVVSRQRSGKIAIGATAKRNQAVAPHDTIVEIKRQMGEKTKVRLGDLEKTPQEISAMILTRIKELAEEELGEPVTGVVISCPAYFMDPARAATKEAGQLAGLNVLRIVNEPTAAAYAYGIRETDADKEQLFLVYDLGGGTFDVTVIKIAGASIDVIGTGGDPHLGGANFDDRIVDWMIAELAKTDAEYVRTIKADQKKLEALRMRLKVAAEEAKIALCNMKGEDAAHTVLIGNVDAFQGKPVSFNGTLTRAHFESIITDLLQNSLKWIDEAMKVPKEKHNYGEEHLTAVLLVGGSTRVPLVRGMLEKRFPSTAIWGQERGINPDEIVALGASLVAADADDTLDVADMGDRPQPILVDVTGHTLSVAVMDEQKGREILAPLIAKETSIPCHAEHPFQSRGEGQAECRVKIYQGEGIEIDPDRVKKIAEFQISIPPKREPTPLMIGLQLNEDGILIAHATNRETGATELCRIDYNDSAQIDPKELERKRKELQEQLQSVIGSSGNPLDSDTQPQAPPRARPQPAAASGYVGNFDPKMLSGVLRMLYERAMSDFLRVPADRQPALAQLVSDIEQAAQAGDRERLNAYVPELTRLLQGVN